MSKIFGVDGLYLGVVCVRDCVVYDFMVIKLIPFCPTRKGKARNCWWWLLDFNSRNWVVAFFLDYTVDDIWRIVLCYF